MVSFVFWKSSPGTNDQRIPDDAQLWRRIRPTQVIFDGNINRLRPTSDAFRNTSDTQEMSVALEKIVEQTGRTAKDILIKYPGQGIAAFTAEFARSLDEYQGVVFAPKPPDEIEHGHIVGDKTKEKLRKKFAKESRILIEPQGIEHPPEVGGQP